MRSDIEIQKFVRSKLIYTELAQSVTGKVCDRERPANSSKEDIVISVLANENAGQIQTAFVNVNIYVSDIFNTSSDDWERDTIRCDYLCGLAKSLYTMREGDFIVMDRYSTPPRVMRIDVEFEDGHTEHLINCKLFVKISNEV